LGPNILSCSLNQYEHSIVAPFFGREDLDSNKFCLSQVPDMRN
jgi:hypothetical protein